MFELTTICIEYDFKFTVGCKTSSKLFDCLLSAKVELPGIYKDKVIIVDKFAAKI